MLLSRLLSHATSAMSIVQQVKQPMHWAQLAEGVASVAAQEAAAEVLAESGVAELEARVLAFLYRHSGALRLLATIDDSAQLLLQVRPPANDMPVPKCSDVWGTCMPCVVVWNLCQRQSGIRVLYPGFVLSPSC